jgi:heme-degrading monooxygenase HmoA
LENSIQVKLKASTVNPGSEDDLRTIDEIRIKALRDRGYIGGETVVNADDRREVLVFSAWSSVDDWKTWYGKKEWEELEKELIPYLEEPAKIRIFMPGADYAKKAFK